MNSIYLFKTFGSFTVARTTGARMQISCATATPLLSNRDNFPNYFQFLPSTVDFAPAYLSIIKEFKWRHVVILLQDENLYTMVITTLITVDMLNLGSCRPDANHWLYVFL